MRSKYTIDAAGEIERTQVDFTSTHGTETAAPIPHLLCVLNTINGRPLRSARMDVLLIRGVRKERRRIFT